MTDSIRRGVERVDLQLVIVNHAQNVGEKFLNGEGSLGAVDTASRLLVQAQNNHVDSRRPGIASSRGGAKLTRRRVLELAIDDGALGVIVPRGGVELVWVLARGGRGHCDKVLDRVTRPEAITRDELGRNKSFL